MQLRFCLYGFLKNQRYFEPFLVLAFVERGLSFFQIGLLIGIREITINIMEIPSGAVADLYGRRRSMIFSFSSYIASFVLFALSTTFAGHVPAMLLFGIGEAFRTGTHKAMIFDWLKSRGREREKTKFYGLTRAWSKRGSALSVLIAAAIVISTREYRMVFWFSLIPYILGIVNFLGYPAFLDGSHHHPLSVGRVFTHLRQTFTFAIHRRPLRRLLLESMTHEGTFSTTKDYVQPLLKQAALALPIMAVMQPDQRAAVLVGAVYFVLHLMSAYASQNAHRFAERCRTEDRAARALWVFELGIFVALAFALLFDATPAAILCFVGLAVLQNIWKPIYLGRLDEVSDADLGATMLSVDSQLKSFYAMAVAPLLGLAVDHLGFWPVGVLGAAGAALVLSRMGHTSQESPSTR